MNSIKKRSTKIDPRDSKMVHNPFKEEKSIALDLKGGLTKTLTLEET